MGDANDENKRFALLLVEDNQADIGLIKQAQLECKIAFDLHTARDGMEAIDFLRQQRKFTDAPLPDLILLDLNMPRKDGRKVLLEIKNDEDLRRIPVVVLTTSNGDQDVREAYELHANTYIVKPIDFHEFVEVINAIIDYWFSLAKLAPNPMRH